MIKNTLYSKIINSDFEKTLTNKGYTFFTKGDYNLNIIGVRKTVKNNEITNKFDDYIVIIYKVRDKWYKDIYPITTEPGYHYMVKELGNIKGTAILVPNQYRGCWKIGKHKGAYTALVQTKPVKVYRDNNKDKIYDLDPQTTDTGIFGINIHRASKYAKRETVDMYSAGCQVFNSPRDFGEFLRLCREQESRYGNSFTYTLITENDLC